VDASEEAFDGCSELVTVKLPAHPISYSGNVFKGCSKLSLAVRSAIKATGYEGEF
jgi:hypothetical protein